MAQEKPDSGFTGFAKWIARQSGRPATFIVAVSLIIIWAVTGPIFGFSDTWQLIINTGTTVITFLMVFLIQNTQNRDTAALQVKLDELIRVLGAARNELIDAEKLDEKDMDRIKAGFEKVAKQARNGVNAPETEVASQR